MSRRGRGAGRARERGDAVGHAAAQLAQPCRVGVRRQREDSDRAPRIEAISPLAAFPEIMGNLLTHRDIPDESAEVDFRFSSRLAGRVPVFALTAHADPARLAELCRLVAGRVAGLPHPSGASTPAAHV